MKHVLALFVLGSVAAADELHLKSGGKLEGVARREGDKVYVENLGGVATVNFSEIAKIDTTHTSKIEIYHEKLKAVDASQDPIDFLRLALWVKREGGRRFVKPLCDRAEKRSEDAAVAALSETIQDVDAAKLDLVEKYFEKAAKEGDLALAVWTCEKHLDVLTRLHVRRAVLAADNFDKLVTLAENARKLKLGAMARPVWESIAGTADKQVDARRLLELTSQAWDLGFREESVKLADRAVEIVKEMQDVPNIQALAEFAYDRKLLNTSKRLWRRILEVDAKNETARRGSGYRRFQGEWLTEEEWQAAQGRGEFEGTWMTPGERELILKERSLKLDARVRELEKREEKAEELAREAKRLLEKAEDRLKDLEAREKKLKEREDEVGRFEKCRSCGYWWSGKHWCEKDYTWCGTCGGWFKGWHNCKK